MGRTVPLSETSSLKLARSYTTRLLFFSRSDSPTSRCCGNHGATRLPPPVCARHAVLMQTALGSPCCVPAPQGQALGRQEDWECSIFLHRTAQARRNEPLDTPVWLAGWLCWCWMAPHWLCGVLSDHRTGLLLGLVVFQPDNKRGYIISYYFWILWTSFSIVMFNEIYPTMVWQFL